MHAKRLFALLGLWLAVPTGLVTAQSRFSFRQQQIEPSLGVGYAVSIADVDGDDAPDIVAINEDSLLWYSNPSWTRQVVARGETEKDNVCLAPHDIDGDGQVDFVIGAAWRPRDTQGGGTLQWLSSGGSARPAWTLLPITSEPTLHRIRWGDVDGDGVQELIVAPLHGRGNVGPRQWEGAGVRILVVAPPSGPGGGAWDIQVANQSFHIVHNIWTVDFDGDGSDEILTASYEGIHLLDREPGGTWTSRLLAPGIVGENARGAGEIKVGRLRNGRRYLASVEPWHGNHIVVYFETGKPDSPWSRHVVTDRVGAGHALWTADLDGDGDQELAFGWRGNGTREFASPGVALFDPTDSSLHMIDSGGMATEDLVASDLDGNGRIDLIASGRSTHNLKIYWNQP